MIKRVKGSVDLSGRDLTLLRSIEDVLGSYLGRFGYKEVATPILEDTDLFLRKSGGAMAARMYSFVDQGRRRVSMRPEFTASLMRSYLERESDLPLPVRWRYAGPVFRYEQRPDRPYRQLTQLGIELIGAASVRADAEIISVAWEGLERLGLRKASLVVGHVGVVQGFLEEIGLSERAQGRLLETLGELSRGATTMEAERLSIEQELPLPDMPKNGVWEAAVASLGEEGLKALVMELLSGLGARDTGTREGAAIVGRFMQRQRAGDNRERLAKGLELVGELHELKGAPADVLARTATVARRYGLGQRQLDDVAALMDSLAERSVGEGQVELDLGLARGIAYYTGMVFEIRGDGLKGDLPLCGGGRYDGLVRALGGTRDVPALGFAYWVERLAEALALEEGRLQTKSRLEAVLVLPATPAAYRQALKVAAQLRDMEVAATVDVESVGLAQGLEFARQCRIRRVLEVGEDGSVKEHALPVSGAEDGGSCCD